MTDLDKVREALIVVERYYQEWTTDTGEQVIGFGHYSYNENLFSIEVYFDENGRYLSIHKNFNA